MYSPRNDEMLDKLFNNFKQHGYNRLGKGMQDSEKKGIPDLEKKDILESEKKYMLDSEKKDMLESEKVNQAVLEHLRQQQKIPIANPVTSIFIDHQTPFSQIQTREQFLYNFKPQNVGGGMLNKHGGNVAPPVEDEPIYVVSRDPALRDEGDGDFPLEEIRQQNGGRDIPEEVQVQEMASPEVPVSQGGALSRCFVLATLVASSALLIYVVFRPNH